MRTLANQSFCLRVKNLIPKTQLETNTLNRELPSAVLRNGTVKIYESDDEKVFEDGENIDKDTLADEEEHQSPPPNKEQLESSHAQESDSDSSCPDALRKYDNILPLTEKQLWAQHEEAAVSYVVLKDSIEGYYEEDVDHRDQTDKLVQATMDCVDKNSTKRADPLKALNGVTETLKVVQEAVKDDLALNRKVIESTEAYTKNSTSLYEMLTLIKNFDFQGLKSSVEYLQATAISQDQHLAAWAKSSTSMAWNLSNRLTSIESSVPATLAITAAPASIEGENVANTANEEQPSHTRGSMLLWRMILRKVPYIINGKTHYLTNDEINAHIEKGDKIKKATKKAKMFAKTKSEVIKVVQEEAEKIGLDSKTIVSAQAGKKFKKAQDAEHQVLKREHSQKIKRLMELNKKKAENNDKRNFQVPGPFKFYDFGVTELDELGPNFPEEKEQNFQRPDDILGKEERKREAHGIRMSNKSAWVIV
ncbi:hypothetical protein Tco_1110523 [Tanacetum coccineum]|uniref:Uncharacterized protein n=1 Tax=Tanacetum coccineum TaxID=301880 RepID=A0ABQ5IKG9_9ASTR